MQQIDQIIDEILQIIEQYKKEVPEARRAWPTSIRERVVSLRQLDLSDREIAERTGIPKATVYVMARGKKYGKPKMSRNGRFLAVPVTSRRETPTQKNSEDNSENLTAKVSKVRQEFVSATLPGGIRVEGLSIESLVELSRSLLMSFRLRSGHRVYVFTEYVDLRAGFNKLSMMVREKMKAKLLDGDLFLFMGKNRKKLKAICFDGTGLLLIAKRLE